MSNLVASNVILNQKKKTKIREQVMGFKIKQMFWPENTIIVNFLFLKLVTINNYVWQKKIEFNLAESKIAFEADFLYHKY